MKISLFGKGFIGTEFVNQFDSVVIDRNSLISATPKVLYMRSTIHNYHIFDNPYLDIETNLIHLIRVLESCKNIFGNDFEFNFVSSWFVYGKGVNLPAKEDSICNPTGFYSITKRTAEQLLISYCETYNINYRILRMANVLGVGDKKLGKKKNAVQFLLLELLNGNEIELYEGNAKRDFIDVRDAVKAISLVINNGDLNTIYNIGNGIGVNVQELIINSKNSLNLLGKIKTKPIPEFHRIVQSQDMYLDINKLKSLGYFAEFSIQDTVQWIIDSGRI